MQGPKCTNFKREKQWLVFIKINNFCSVKNTEYGVKQIITWEETFSMIKMEYACRKIRKELLQINKLR